MKPSRINYLKEQISKEAELTKKISLSSDNTVVHIDISDAVGFQFVEASKCYEMMQFDYMFDQVHLSNHKLILNELFNEVLNHLFEYVKQSRHYYNFYFPLDLNNMKDLNIVIPDKLKVKIISNEIVVQLLSSVKRIYLYVGKYYKRLENDVKFNLQQINDSMLSTFGNVQMDLANGYGCLVILIK